MAENPMVLIVDDDRIQLVLMKKLFEKAGIKASCAKNGEEALRKMGAHTFSCLITDLNMPCMNGIELADKAKSLAPRMLIALCTGENFSNIRWNANYVKIDAVFTKPINYSDMLRWVHRKVQKLNSAVPDGLQDDQLPEKSLRLLN